MRDMELQFFLEEFLPFLEELAVSGREPRRKSGHSTEKGDRSATRPQSNQRRKLL